MNFMIELCFTMIGCDCQCLFVSESGMVTTDDGYFINQRVPFISMTTTSGRLKMRGNRGLIERPRLTT